MPDAAIVAVAGVTELHVPPLTASLSVVVPVGHTVNVPVMVPALGNGFTVTVLVTVQPPVSAYEIVAVPADTPVTIPVVPTVARSGLLELHVPPVGVLLYVTVLPMHITLSVLVIADGAWLTVTVILLTQAKPDTKVIVSMPGSMPVAMPEEEPMVAISVLLLLHLPPVSTLEYRVVAPVQICCTPVMGEATHGGGAIFI